MKKIFIAIVLLIILTVIFTILNSGLEINKINLFIQPLIFATCATVCILYTKYRKLLLAISGGLLALMITTYLFNQIDFANWVGSLGFGILFITSFSYIRMIIKKGNIETF